LEMATGEYIALLDHDDELPEDALYMVASELNNHPDADLIYSDEDKIDENGTRYDPHFKTDWNPDLFFCQNFICHLGVYRTSIIAMIGGFRDEYLGSQDYDLALRVVGKTSPDRIRHIPQILYHWRAIPGSVALSVTEKSFAPEAGILAVQSFFDDCGVQARVDNAPGTFHNRVTYATPDPPPVVSIIVPTAGKDLDCLNGFVQGLFDRTDYPNLELILVANNVGTDAAKRSVHLLSKKPKVSVLSYDKSFNFADIYNTTVPKTTGPLIGLLNDDLIIRSSRWLSEMVSHAVRREIGAVGAMLYYKNDTIQHAGVILGRGGVAAHAYRGYPRGAKGYFFRASLIQNYSAITAACMVMRREVFEEVGGFDSNLAVAYNDVDLCLRIRNRGYRILWTPYAELYHLESASRGPDKASQAGARLKKEIEHMKQKWGVLLANDHYYNPNLSLDSGRFELAFPPRVAKPWLEIGPEWAAGKEQEDISGE
jgi:O-antigen biosynthesis protein